MTIEEMKARKRELGLSNEMVSARSGVPLGTVQKIFGGATKSPRKETIDALTRVLKERDDSEYTYTSEKNREMYVRENSGTYAAGPKKTDGYTTKDYYALPDDARVELIDGVFYDMASPSKLHQGILIGILIQLDSCIQDHSNGCFLYMAPSDVEMGENNNTVVQPDIYVNCDPEKESKERFYGAPDFIIEIMSQSNWRNDMYRKLKLYGDNGVREYWIVDPERKRVIAYDFGNSDFISLYTFDDEVPVKISDGKCSVDFRKVFDRVKHLYEE